MKRGTAWLLAALILVFAASSVAQTPLTLTVTITPAANGQSKITLNGQAATILAWLKTAVPTCAKGVLSPAANGCVPAGGAGTQGPQGIPGPPGPAGAAGSGNSLLSFIETPTQLVATKPIFLNTPTLPVGFTATPTAVQLAACDALVPAPGFVFQCVSTKGCMRRSILNSAVVCQ